MRQVEADGEKVAIGPEERPEVHAASQAFGAVNQTAKPIEQLHGLGLANRRGEGPNGIGCRVRARSLQLAQCCDHAIEPAGCRDQARRRQKFRANRGPGLASILIEPPYVRLMFARTHCVNPRSDGGELGSPRSHLGQQAVRPRHRLATPAGRSRAML